MKKILILAFSSFIFFSCNESSQNSGSEAEVATKEEALEHDADHDHDSDATQIELNNGERWAVNEEMKPFIAGGEKLVNDFVESKSNQFKELAENLKEQNNQLIKSCTMEGKSHDELHKWLHPHLELVKELGEEEDATKAAEIVSHINKSYVMYNEFFK